MVVVVVVVMLSSLSCYVVVAVVLFAISVHLASPPRRTGIMIAICYAMIITSNLSNDLKNN